MTVRAIPPKLRGQGRRLRRPRAWRSAWPRAVERAAESLRDLRVAEVIEQDMTVEDGKVTLYRAKVRLSFKYEGGD